MLCGWWKLVTIILTMWNLYPGAMIIWVEECRMSRFLSSMYFSRACRAWQVSTSEVVVSEYGIHCSTCRSSLPCMARMPM